MHSITRISDPRHTKMSVITPHSNELFVFSSTSGGVGVISVVPGCDSSHKPKVLTCLEACHSDRSRSDEEESTAPSRTRWLANDSRLWSKSQGRVMTITKA